MNIGKASSHRGGHDDQGSKEVSDDLKQGAKGSYSVYAVFSAASATAPEAAG